tara:strand:+ start:13163 stop:13450 length:288 start_codon:yes stop_codon:yes gene_type:complete
LIELDGSHSWLTQGSSHLETNVRARQRAWFDELTMNDLLWHGVTVRWRRWRDEMPSGWLRPRKTGSITALRRTRLLRIPVLIAQGPCSVARRRGQ